MSAHGLALSRQNGATLVVVSVLLVLVAALALASVRTLILQDRMNTNTIDRTLALQSAKRVMKNLQAMLQIEASNNNMHFVSATTGSADCTLANASDDSTRCTAEGLCLAPGPQCQPRWQDWRFSNWATVVSTHAADPSLAAGNADAELSNGFQQQYFVEYLGDNFMCYANPATGNTCKGYRVTVRTKPGTDRAMVQLQANYIVELLPSGNWDSYVVSSHEIVN